MSYQIIQRLKLIPTKVIILGDLILLALLLYYLNIATSYKSAASNSNLDSQVKQQAQKIAAICFGKGGWNCFKEEFSKITRQNGLEFAESTLDAIQEIDPFLKNCHIIAHAISQAATKKDPSHWQDLMQKVNIYSCGGGFLHGILETHMADNPDFSITSKFINELCPSLKEDEKKRMCSHGLGHLILVERNADLVSSIPVCDGVTKDGTGIALECYIGLFMEDHQKLALAEHGITEFPSYTKEYAESLQNNCLKYDGIASVACWNEMAEIYAKTWGYDPDKIYEFCLKAPQKDAAAHCFLKGVALLAVEYDYTTSDKLLSVCKPYEGQEADYKNCINYMITSMMYYSSKFTDRGITLCSSIDEKYRKDCFKDLGALLKKNVSVLSERETFCNGTPSQYRIDCTSP